ncbi:MAG: DNA gyrase inhibitor YacG, partial [Acidobacteria bacterium]|nr:DNA gyrase inhibitor YacG [Acidobacteriota bacterium]
SERCRLIDFGAWADEQYSLPVEDAVLSEEEAEELERALKEKMEDGSGPGIF